MTPAARWKRRGSAVGKHGWIGDASRAEGQPAGNRRQAIEHRAQSVERVGFRRFWAQVKRRLCPRPEAAPDSSRRRASKSSRVARRRPATLGRSATLPWHWPCRRIILADRHTKPWDRRRRPTLRKALELARRRTGPISAPLGCRADRADQECPMPVSRRRSPAIVSEPERRAARVCGIRRRRARRARRRQRRLGNGWPCSNPSHKCRRVGRGS